MKSSIIKLGKSFLEILKAEWLSAQFSRSVGIAVDHRFKKDLRLARRESPTN